MDRLVGIGVATEDGGGGGGAAVLPP